MFDSLERIFIRTLLCPLLSVSLSWHRLQHYLTPWHVLYWTQEFPYLVIWIINKRAASFKASFFTEIHTLWGSTWYELHHCLLSVTFSGLIYTKPFTEQSLILLCFTITGRRKSVKENQLNWTVKAKTWEWSYQWDDGELSAQQRTHTLTCIIFERPFFQIKSYPQHTFRALLISGFSFKFCYLN